MTLVLPAAATAAAHFNAPNAISNRFPFEATTPDADPEADWYILKFHVDPLTDEAVPTVVPNRKDGVDRTQVETWANDEVQPLIVL